MTGTLTLPARLDLVNTRPLADDILARAGGDLIIDAGGVGHLGALAAQVLLAAARDWKSAGHRLTIAPRSAAFDEALAVLGLGDHLGTGAGEWA